MNMKSFFNRKSLLNLNKIFKWSHFVQDCLGRKQDKNGTLFCATYFSCKESKVLQVLKFVFCDLSARSMNMKKRFLYRKIPFE